MRQQGWFGSLCRDAAEEEGGDSTAQPGGGQSGNVAMWHLYDPSNPIRSQKLIVLIKEIFLCTAPEI